jgi:hypothetical protein
MALNWCPSLHSAHITPSPHAPPPLAIHDMPFFLEDTACALPASLRPVRHLKGLSHETDLPFDDLYG